MSRGSRWRDRVTTTLGVLGLLTSGFAGGCSEVVYPLFDRDQDGVRSDVDCDDEDASVGSLFVDGDGDGAGAGVPTGGCEEAGNGVVSEGGDCDDADPDVAPGKPEQCDDKDNDCDGEVDEDVEVHDYYPDGDADGYGAADGSVSACRKPGGYVPETGDCDDEEAAVHPGALEVCDSVDNDCNGEIDDGLELVTWYADADGDGAGDVDTTLEACAPPEGYVQVSGDCDDQDPARLPGGIEVCDGLDNDCDVDVDEGFIGDTGSPCVDDDGDGYTEEEGDCDDAAPTRSPGVEEECNDFDDDCSGGDGDYLVSPTAYGDTSWIQNAIQMAGEGCTVVVAPGTYRERLDFLGKRLTVRSEGGPDDTIIDAGDSGAVVSFETNEDAGSILDGFTLQNGAGTLVETCCPSRDLLYGGAVYISASSPIVRNCVMTRNEAQLGGAVSSYGGSPQIIDNVITGNTATMYGSGLFFYDVSQGLVSGNLFEGNTAIGAGVSAEGTLDIQRSSSTQIVDNTVRENQANSGGGLVLVGSTGITVAGNTFERNEVNDLGGGMAVTSETEVTIEDNVFVDNVAIEGGAGILCEGSGGTPTVTVRRNLFQGNDGGDDGGGLYMKESCAGEVYHNIFVGNVARRDGYGAAIDLKDVSLDALAPLRIFNNLLYANESIIGGGISVRGVSSTVEIVNNTISDNVASAGAAGVYLADSTPWLANNLITFNRGGQGLEFSGRTGLDPASIVYNDLFGNEDGETSIEGIIGVNGNLELDPLYRDREGVNYELTPESPVANQGDPDADLVDPDGSRNDIGAYGGPGGDW